MRFKFEGWMLSILLKDTGIARIYLQLNFTINVSYKPTTKISGNFYRPQRSWGKVIFSEACVKNSVHGGGGGEHGRGAWVAGDIHGGSGRRACVVGGMHGGHAWQGGVCGRGDVHGRGACMVWTYVEGGVCGRGHVWQGACVADTTRYSQWAGGTHPTGMHSCSSKV